MLVLQVSYSMFQVKFNFNPLNLEPETLNLKS